MCSRCTFETTFENGELSEEVTSIEETGYCLTCAREVGYCAQHDGYTFDSEDVESIKECDMCKECADGWFGEPQSDDPDFMDSYDPDRD